MSSKRPSKSSSKSPRPSKSSKTGKASSSGSDAWNGGSIWGTYDNLWGPDSDNWLTPHAVWDLVVTKVMVDFRKDNTLAIRFVSDTHEERGGVRIAGVRIYLKEGGNVPWTQGPPDRNDFRFHTVPQAGELPPDTAFCVTFQAVSGSGQRSRMREHFAVLRGTANIPVDSSREPPVVGDLLRFRLLDGNRGDRDWVSVSPTRRFCAVVACLVKR